MLHSSMVLMAPGHPYLSLNYSVLLSSGTETFRQVFAPTLSLKSRHHVDTFSNAIQILTPDYFTNSTISIVVDSEQCLNILPLGLSIFNCLLDQYV